MDEYPTADDGNGSVGAALDQFNTCAHRLATALRDADPGRAYAECIEAICSSHQLLTIMVECMPGYLGDMYPPPTEQHAGTVIDRMHAVDFGLAQLAGVLRHLPADDTGGSNAALEAVLAATGTA